MIDLLVVGDCNPDLILSGGDVVPEFGQWEKVVDDMRLVPGGSSTIVAAGAARLGLPTSLVAAVGDDLFGRFMLDAMAERGVDTGGCVIRADVATGLTVALTRGDDRAILTAPGAIATLRAEDVDGVRLRRATHLHVGSYFLLEGLRPGLGELVRTARAAGATVSLDPQGDPAGGWDGGMRDLLPSIDVLFVNETEAAAIDGARAGLVVVKRGARGASAGGVDVAPPAVDAVDATGAGDGLNGALAAALADGADLTTAARRAVVAASLSVTRAGAREGYPTVTELEAALRS
ncbi:MAG TPA: carbohydrate kinase family protein [Gaiellales bacterium]|nr:carbohydrate kinase family protein [Gaiellales bacterium]